MAKATAHPEQYSARHTAVSEQPPRPWSFGTGLFIGAGIIITLTIIGFFGILVASIALLSSSDTVLTTGNVAVIPVQGVITAADLGPFAAEGVADSTVIVEKIGQAASDPAITAIVLEINSPGGSPVASDEIGTALKKTNKTTVAVIREVGASGGYWVASATDHIVANRMSITGSIGVIGSDLDFSGFLTDHNITYRRLVAGKYKDTGSPLRPTTPEEQALMQSTINAIYEIFIDEIAANRKLPPSKVRELATGYVYLGVEAKRLGLIDELGGMDEALTYIEQRENIKASPVWYGDKPSFFDVVERFAGQTGVAIGQGLGEQVLESSSERPALRSS